MKVQRGSTETISYRVNKRDLAEAILGELGECFVSIHSDTQQSYVTIAVRRDKFNEDFELDAP